jgi:hypothetical protein
MTLSCRRGKSSYKPVKKQLEGLGTKSTTPMKSRDKEPAKFRLRK